MRIVWKGLGLGLALLLTSAVCAQQAVTPPMQDNPDGAGHPNAVTCRKPQQMPGSRLMAPPVCLINADWARLRRNGQDANPDGSRVVASEKARSLNPQVCQPVSNVTRGNPMGASMGTGLAFTPGCF